MMKRSRIIKWTVIPLAIIVLSVGAVFAVFPGIDKYVSLRRSSDLREQYVGFSALDILDAKERADQAYKDYFTKLMNNEDYETVLYMIRNDNQYTGLVNKTGLSYDFQDTDIEHAYYYIDLKNKNYNYSKTDLIKLRELRKIGYLDSETMFMKYCSDKIGLYCNTSQSDWATNEKSISMSKPWYIHVYVQKDLTAYQGTKQLRYKLSYPDGTVLNDDLCVASSFAKVVKEHNTDEMSKPTEGTLTVELFIDDELIQTIEINQIEVEEVYEKI